MLQKISSVYVTRISSRLIHSLTPVIPELVRDCPELTGMSPVERWGVENVFPSLSDMTVMIIGPGDGSVSAVLYLPGSDRAVADFERRKRVTGILLEDKRIADVHKYLPQLLYEGTYEHRPYWILNRLPGISLGTLLHGSEREAVLRLAIRTAGEFHRRTARQVKVDSHLLDRWVSRPIRVILKSPLKYYHQGSRLLLERLEKKLVNALSGEYIVTSWVHGDFWPNNVLVSPDCKQITGIVDWDLAHPDDLPSLDIVNFLLSACREIQGVELGQVIVETHRRGGWEIGMQEIWDLGIQPLDIHVPDLQDSLLLFWLRHMSSNLEKSHFYSMNPVWAVKNYQFIINYLETNLMS